MNTRIDETVKHFWKRSKQYSNTNYIDLIDNCPKLELKYNHFEYNNKI